MAATDIHWGDHVAAWLSPARRLFGHGWGDDAALASLARPGRFDEAPRAIDLVWTRAPSRTLGITVGDAVFESPVRELPAASRTAHVRWISFVRPEEARSRPVYVVLAASGDAGYGTRELLWASYVRNSGSVLLLENPLYGPRRPAHQVETNVATVSDHLAMNVAMVEEARALLAWLGRAGFTRLGIAGFSMGGSMAALCAAVSREPIAVAIFAAGASAVPIFTEGLLSRSVDFETLARTSGSERAARERLASLFEGADLDRHPPPIRSDAAVIVAGRRDGYVKPESIRQLASHWRGSEVRWLDTGHAGALVLHPHMLIAAARDAMRRL